LREEVAALQKQSDVLQGDKDKIVAQIEQLEASIARYKGEYAEDIREIELIKGEMDVVSNKVRVIFMHCCIVRFCCFSIVKGVVAVIYRCIGRRRYWQALTPRKIVGSPPPLLSRINCPPW